MYNITCCKTQQETQRGNTAGRTNVQQKK